jgi:transposase
MDGPPCNGCRELLKRVAELDALVADLTRKLEAVTRAGKRQAAPFRKGPPKPDPKTPGRKPGEAHGKHGHRPTPTPDQIRECHEVPLPAACPHCQNVLVEDDVVEQFQTDIPLKPVIRKFRIHRGHCPGCGKTTQGRHPLQTSDAIGAAASQIGPAAQAAAATLHTQDGLSHGKVAKVFETLFGIPLTRGASAQINRRAAARLEGDYRTVLDDLRRPQHLTPDETGWRLGGCPAWLHVWVGERATAYAIDPQRSADALERVIGRDWSGVLCHDGYATYNRFGEAVHQSCVAHVLRRAKGLLETARGGAVRFPREVIDLFTEAVHLRNEHRRGAVSLEYMEDQREVFDDRLLDLVSRPRRRADYTRFADHLWNNFEQWFSFVFDPTVEATNWQAEQAIRPAVVNRKVWGGNRTATGAKAQGILMSVFETVKRSARSVVDYVRHSLCAFGNRVLPRPVILLGR